MRRIVLITILLFSILQAKGQVYDQVVFDYDVAGNQIKRYLVDIDIRPSGENPKNIKEITEEDLVKSDIYDDIRYYPNPVKQDLFVTWQLVNDNYVQSIQMYTINGKLLKTFENLDKLNEFVIPFQDLPEGLYSINLLFKDGEQKSLKVIKNGI